MQTFDELDSAWRKCLFDESPIAMAVVALDHRFVRSNHSFCELVGYSHSEIYIRTWQSITHPDDVAGDQSGAETLKHDPSADIYTTTKRYLHKRGHSVWVNLHVRGVWDEGKFHSYFVVAVPSPDQTEKQVAVHPKQSIVEWIKSHPSDAVLMGGAASLILGRDTLLEIVKALLLK